MPFTNQTYAYSRTPNYLVPFYYCELGTGSFRVGRNIMGMDLRNYALNSNYLSSCVTRWAGPGFFPGPLSNSMDSNPLTTYHYTIDSFGLNNSYWSQYLSNKMIGFTQNFYSSGDGTGGSITNVVLGDVRWRMVPTGESSITYFNSDKTNQVSDESFFVTGASSALYSVKAKEIFRFDTSAKSNYFFTRSSLSGLGVPEYNQYVDVNSLNPGAFLACPGVSESISIPGIFKNLNWYKNSQAKILWQNWIIEKGTAFNITTSTYGFFADSTTRVNFFDKSGTEMVPRPMVFGTATSSYQTRKSARVDILAVAETSNTGFIEFTSSVTGTAVGTLGGSVVGNGNPTWYNIGNITIPTENIRNTLLINPSWLNGTGNFNINLRKSVSINSSPFIVYAVVISEEM